MKKLAFVIIVCLIISASFIACNGDEGRPEDAAREVVVKILESCKKGEAEKAYKQYISAGLEKPGFLQDDFEYTILEVIKDDRIENRYFVLVKLELENEVKINVTFGYKSEENKVDYLDWVYME